MENKILGGYYHLIIIIIFTLSVPTATSADSFPTAVQGQLDLHNKGIGEDKPI